MSDNQHTKEAASTHKVTDEMKQKMGQLFDKEEKKVESQFNAAQEKIEQLEHKIQEQQDSYKEQEELLKRSIAELQNSLRRKEQEKDQAVKFANEKFFKEFILILDSLDSGLAALKQTQGNTEQFIEGTNALNRQLLTALENFGLNVITPQVGDVFDPNLYEALATAVHPQQENHTIASVIQGGYTLNGRLLRPARVIVVKNP